MLKIKNLKKSFGNNPILKDISMHIKKGEVVSIIGPSGAGKSTFLRCINYLEKPDSGKIILDNKEIDYSNINIDDIQFLRKNTSMVFQNYHLFANKTAIENIMEPMIYVQKKSKDESRKIAKDLLEQVSLAHKEEAYPITLSGGEQQRIGIARALAVYPKVILLDEPTSSLDPELVGEVLKVLENLSTKDFTMIIVTHELHFARKISDKIIFIDDGYIIEEGSANDLYLHPKKERTKLFLTSFT